MYCASTRAVSDLPTPPFSPPMKWMCAIRADSFRRRFCTATTRPSRLRSACLDRLVSDAPHGTLDRGAFDRVPAPRPRGRPLRRPSSTTSDPCASRRNASLPKHLASAPALSPLNPVQRDVSRAQMRSHKAQVPRLGRPRSDPGAPACCSDRRAGSARRRETCHRRGPASSTKVRRADLPGAADRPVGLLASCQQAAHARVVQPTCPARRGPDAAHRARVASQPAGLRREEVNRQFEADRPNQLWVSDFTCVSTGQGGLYVAFVIDVFARRIVGWRVGSSMHTDFVLDALAQAPYARQPERDSSRGHHSDRGSRCVSIR